mgnify:CR=1 FL=1
MKPFVLIAEDESAVSELLLYNLQKEDYEVAIAADGEEALMMIDERAPDLILLDWMRRAPERDTGHVAHRARRGERPDSGS